MPSREPERIRAQRTFPAPPEELLDYIRKGSVFFIAGHREPDGDCVGSELALASVLRRLGKEAIPCSSGPFKKTEVSIYEKQFLLSFDKVKKDGARLIVTDCGALERTGDIASQLEGLPLAVIDHHEAGKPYPQEVPIYQVPDAPATTVLILKLIEALGLEPSTEEAELLLFGLCTDTGFFRHVDNCGAETFETAARLVRFGASPQKTFLAINGGKSLDSRIFMGCVLANAESHFDGRLIISTEEYEDFRRFGLEGRDSDAIYQQFQSITGVEAIVLIRQETPGNCTAGLRSRDRVDVAKIAKSFGGGGHKNASGINSLGGTIAEIKPKILEAFKSEFSS